MIALLCALIGIQLCIIIVQSVKIRLMHKAALEIAEAFHVRLATDTNTLIDISSRDRRMRKLAREINTQLRLLRKQRNQYLSGDRELKEAIANISHDLRTPLTAICGYLELLEREEQSDAVRRYLSIVAGRAETMKALTEELFRYSVIVSAVEDLMPEPVNMTAVLEEAIAAQYANLCNSGIVPIIQMPNTAVIRNLNREGVARVLDNLITNAIRYSDGDLSIELSEDGTVVFSNAASGMDEVQAGKLFDRFYTVTSARHSTGLGLSIAKALTEQMGGQIRARCAEGRLSIAVAFPQPPGQQEEPKRTRR